MSDVHSEPSPRRVIAFRILAGLTGLFFLVSVTNVSAPWIVLIDMGDPHAWANRWFITVAGTEDLIQCVALLALAWRPRQPLLFLFLVVAAAIATVVNVPFNPFFLVVLAILLPALLAYPYWADLRGARRWWDDPDIPLLAVGLVTAAVVLTVATLSMVRQIGGEGPASDANWWADYAEHITLLAVAVLVASSARPGWRVLTAAAAFAWLYLGLVGAVFIPDVDGSWGVLGGSAAMLVGAVLGGLTLADAPRRWRLWPKQHPRPVA